MYVTCTYLDIVLRYLDERQNEIYGYGLQEQYSVSNAFRDNVLPPTHPTPIPHNMVFCDAMHFLQ